MHKRIITKIGDVFCVELANQTKSYFQYIANDLFNLNSSVIRVFDCPYFAELNPSIDEIMNNPIAFYAHTVLKFGIQNRTWYRIGNSNNLGIDDLRNITFGLASDTKIHNDTKIEFVNPLENWSIWHIGEELKNVGILSEELKNKIEIGSVISSSQIVDRIMYGFYTFSANEYKLLKRYPRKGINIFTKKENNDLVNYFHFRGENLVRQIIISPSNIIKLSIENPMKNNYKMLQSWFSDIYWIYSDFIKDEDFEKLWNK